MIDVFDLMRTVWRHRVWAVATLAVVMAATSAYVFTQKPVYQSTETLQLSSADPAFFSEVNMLTPLYSELLSAQQTLTLAQAGLGSAPLATLAVRIFTDSPVIKVDATGGSALVVQMSAAAVVSALSDRLDTQPNLGATGVTLTIIDGPSHADIVWPRPALSLGVAAIVGVLLGVAMSWLASTPWRQLPTRAVGSSTAPATRDSSGPAGDGATGTIADNTRPAQPRSHTTRPPQPRSRSTRAR
jgi:capsular polysaccharide biosynthesis protein